MIILRPYSPVVVQWCNSLGLCRTSRALNACGICVCWPLYFHAALQAATLMVVVQSNNLFYLLYTCAAVFLLSSSEFELTELLHFTVSVVLEDDMQPHVTSHLFFFPRILCDSVATERCHSPLSSSPLPINSLSSQNQGPSSPDPAARHSPYHYHSSESLDYLSGLMPKTLSPTPYVPSGAGSMAYAVSRTNVSGCVSPSASPVTVSALSHYSSSTAGLLDELQICSLDTPGASPTPSPTLSHVSAYTSTAGPDDALTASTAAAATFTNVIISATLTCHDQHQTFPSFPTHLDDWSQPALFRHSSFTFFSCKLQLTSQTWEEMSAHFYSFMLMCLLIISVLLRLSVFVSCGFVLLLVIILSLQGQRKKDYKAGFTYWNQDYLYYIRVIRTAIQDR